MTEAIGVRELRQNASRYLAKVEAGEEVLVTNRGRLVARLVPINEPERNYRALVDAGIVIPPRNPGALVEPLPAADGQSLSALLDEMRNES